MKTDNFLTNLMETSIYFMMCAFLDGTDLSHLRFYIVGVIRNKNYNFSPKFCIINKLK